MLLREPAKGASRSRRVSSAMAFIRVTHAANECVHLPGRLHATSCLGRPSCRLRYLQRLVPRCSDFKIPLRKGCAPSVVMLVATARRCPSGARPSRRCSLRQPCALHHSSLMRQKCSRRYLAVPGNNDSAPSNKRPRATGPKPPHNRGTYSALAPALPSLAELVTMPTGAGHHLTHRSAYSRLRRMAGKRSLRRSPPIPRIL